ncbi:MAG: hypothetical protein JF620_06305, partial [Mesorhizobium sp.]|nr:hypothetical protein [Mesorhizobium sp.]
MAVRAGWLCRGLRWRIVLHRLGLPDGTRRSALGLRGIRVSLRRAVGVERGGFDRRGGDDRSHVIAGHRRGIGQECLAELQAGQRHHDGGGGHQDRLAAGLEQIAYPQRLHRAGHRRLALQRVGFRSRGLRRAARRRDEIGLGGIGLGAFDRLAALIAHALHDGIEIRRAGTGLQRPVGGLGVERFVDVDAWNVGHWRRAGERQGLGVLLAFEGAGQPAEHRLLAAGLLAFLGDSIRSERGHGGCRGCLGGRALRTWVIAQDSGGAALEIG